MKKIRIFWVILALSVSFQSYATNGLDQYQTKEILSQIKDQIGKSPLDKRGPLLVQLAQVYCQDQDQENAFRTYLLALAFVPKHENISMSIEEEAHYNKALEIYLSHNSGFGAREAGQKLLQEYATILEQNPHYYNLGFLVAAAHANLGEYENFFALFYPSYLKYPDSYMAYRTKAILHIKLHERARSDQEREEQRKSIYDNILIASSKKRDDASLYKLMIVFAEKNVKPEVIKNSLSYIVENNVVVPRADIIFFVTEALNNGNIELAQNFVNKARDWYIVSRVVSGAQEMIDNVQKRKV